MTKPMDFWNQKKLQAPVKKRAEIMVHPRDLINIIKAFQNVIGLFSRKRISYVQMESAMLRRILYKFKLRWRNNKVYGCMKKLSKTLLIFKEFHFHHKVQEVFKRIPRCVKGNNIYMIPYIDIIDYILVLTQGFAKLCCCVANYAVEAAYYFELRLNAGDNPYYTKIWKLLLGLVSRIYILFVQFARGICVFYSNLLNLRVCFPDIQKTKRWLPYGYIFPRDLKNWLDIDFLGKSQNVEKNNYETLMKLQAELLKDLRDNIQTIDLTEEIEICEDDVEFINEYIDMCEDEEIIKIDDSDIDLVSFDSDDKLHLQRSICESLKCKCNGSISSLNFNTSSISPEKLVVCDPLKQIQINEACSNSKQIGTSNIMKRADDYFIIDSDEESKVQCKNTRDVELYIKNKTPILINDTDSDQSDIEFSNGEYILL